MHKRKSHLDYNSSKEGDTLDLSSYNTYELEL